MTDAPVLVVLAGRPGTGKTTLSRLVARDLRAALLRVDAVETAVARSGLDPSGSPVGYAVVHDLAAACLGAGTPVVVDAVNPVAEARAGWRSLADAARAVLLVVEVVLTDGGEHRRRVEARTPDLPGQVVPTWEQVTAWPYEPWDEERDGGRLVVDGAAVEAARAAVLAAVRATGAPDGRAGG